MFYLDTNCILRFLTNDIPAQAERIEKRFKQTRDKKQTIIILPIVIVETLFQLEHWYKLDRKVASEKIMTFLSPDWVVTEEKPHILSSLELYKTSRLDIVDLLIFCIAKGNSASILSFDRDFDTLTPALRIEP